MKPKAATKAERRHMQLVADLGCIACERIGYSGVPCEIHHILDCGRRTSHFAVIGLCAGHHRTNDEKHGMGPARHCNKTAFEKEFGSEQELLAVTMAAVKELEALTV